MPARVGVMQDAEFGPPMGSGRRGTENPSYSHSWRNAFGIGYLLEAKKVHFSGFYRQFHPRSSNRGEAIHIPFAPPEPEEHWFQKIAPTPGVNR